MIFPSERLITELTLESLFAVHALDVGVQAPRGGQRIATFAADVPTVLEREQREGHSHPPYKNELTSVT